MASNYGIVNEEIKEQFHHHHHHDHHHDHHHHHQVTSPRMLRRSASSSPTSCGGQGGAPKCVCAPATHAGSFKCRLHRTNSHGSHSPPTATAPSPPTAPVSSVEAQ